MVYKYHRGMSTIKKERDYMFDTFRGLLMWCIPISHFTRVAGSFSAASLSGVIYITINVFVMQAFVFLSGYFSKKPDRARETSFHTFLWPYLLCIPFFYCVRYLIWGHATIDLTIPPFALWYLFALFFYRIFLKNYIKIPYILEISILVYLFAGQVAGFSDKWALGRMVSYFPFFLLGYYCTPEHLKKIRSLKKRWCALLAVVLTGCSCFLAFCTKMPVAFYLLKCPASELGTSWFFDIVFRIFVFFLACGWIILMLNILPNKKNYVAYVGMNTMPIYILHLIVRYEVKKRSIFLGIFPENQVLYYILIFGLASLCVLVFSSKPVVKGYDFVVEGLYKVLLWVLNVIKHGLSYLHVPVSVTAHYIMNMIESTNRTYTGRHGEPERMKDKLKYLREKPVDRESDTTDYDEGKEYDVKPKYRRPAEFEAEAKAASEADSSETKATETEQTSGHAGRRDSSNEPSKGKNNSVHVEDEEPALRKKPSFESWPKFDDSPGEAVNPPKPPVDEPIVSDEN